MTLSIYSSCMSSPVPTLMALYHCYHHILQLKWYSLYVYSNKSSVHLWTLLLSNHTFYRFAHILFTNQFFYHRALKLCQQDLVSLNQSNVDFFNAVCIMNSIAQCQSRVWLAFSHFMIFVWFMSRISCWIFDGPYFLAICSLPKSYPIAIRGRSYQAHVRVCLTT